MQPTRPPEFYVPARNAQGGPVAWPMPHDAMTGAAVGHPLYAPAPPPAQKAAIPPARPIELAALVGVCALADVAIYSGGGGAGFAALLVGVPGMLAIAARGKIPSARLIAISAMLLVLVGRSLWQSSPASIAIGALLMICFAVALRTKRTHVPELVLSTLGTLFGSFQQLWNFGEGICRAAAPTRLKSFAWRTVLVPLGLVSLFALIFTAANPLVQSFVERLWSHASLVKWYPSPLRVFFWCASALAAAALLRPVCREIAERMPSSDVAQAAPSTESMATSRNVLGALNVLFLGYNALDAVYLWAGRVPQGIGHTEYAHRGATWLTVALLMATVVLGFIFRGAVATDPRSKWHFRLAYAWAAQNLVLAAGTFRRIQMYVDFSGLTQLRILGIFGTGLVVVAMALIVIKLARRENMTWLLRRQLDALGIAAILFVVAPTHALCMQFNVGRIERGEYRPLLHLFEQTITAEAVPALATLLEHSDISVRRGAADLLEQQGKVLAEQESRATGWTDVSLSRRSALRVIDANAARIHQLSLEADSSKLRAIATEVNGLSEDSWYTESGDTVRSR